MTPPRAASSGLLVAALVRRDEDLLLVREGDGPGGWVLPGGQVEPGELVHQAMARELWEEAGVRPAGPGRLAFVSQYAVTHDPAWAGMWTVFTFEVTAEDHALAPADPDGLVLEAAWVPLPEARRRLGGIPFGPRREPLLHHLGDGHGGGHLWLWPEGTDGAPVVVHGPVPEPVRPAEAP